MIGFRVLRSQSQSLRVPALVALTTLAALGVAALAGVPPAEGARPKPGTLPLPNIREIGIIPGATPPPAAAKPAARSPGVVTSFPQQVATYPPDGATRVSSNATLYIVFDQPTLKSGSFSVADLDSGTIGTLLNLETPTWSALGDTVFLKPTQPMTLGHRHGMKVNTIFATDGTASNDLPTVFFLVFPRSNVVRINPPADDFSSVTLVPGRAVPVGLDVKETADNTATFTSARIEFWSQPTETFSSGSTPVPIRTTTVAVSQQVPRRGTAHLSAPVTLPLDLARDAASGVLGLRLFFDGTDETGQPYSFEALSARSVVAGDTLLTMAPALVTPQIASEIVVLSAYLEQPLPGAVFAVNDTVRVKGVVTGMGTGVFRAVFYLDGDIAAIEEGYMESGRPVSIEPRGPIPSRRLGEHRFQLVVEAPQNVASRPITFLCVPPVNGITPPPEDVSEKTIEEMRVAPSDETPPDTTVVATPTKVEKPSLTIGGTYLVTGKSEFRDEESAAIAWSAWKAKYPLAKETAFEAGVLWRLRIDDAQNGSASPEQMQLKLTRGESRAEWGDLAPKLAEGAPLFASAVPRRAGQAIWKGSPIGDVEGFLAMDSRPRSAGGPGDQVRSDLYAARVNRPFWNDKIQASLYGGYAHDDPTAGGADSVTRADAVYGGQAKLRFAGDWNLLGDVATVRHKTIEGVEPGRSRTGMRAEITGEVAGFAAKAEAFRYQPDLTTSLNPYAISDRRGGGAEIARNFANWRFFGGYRSEKPDEKFGDAPVIRVDRFTVGGRLELNSKSWVTPTFIRIRHVGPNTAYKETRAATELVAGERYDGQTKGRIDLALLEDEKGENARRLVTSGSLVSTRKLEGRVTTTLSGGVEIIEHQDLDMTDQTVQAAMEFQWETVPGKFLMTPYVTYVDREYDTLEQRDDKLSVRLQLLLVRVPHFGENALAIEGRYDKIDHQDPIESESTETGVQITFGQRFNLLPKQ